MRYIISISICLFGWLALPSQNLIPDSSFRFSESMTKNKYWSREIGNSGAFEDSGFYKGSDKGYEWEYLKVEKIDSTRKEYFDFAPLHFLTETSPVYSDVVFCQFSEPLEKDSIYEIKMWVLPAECIAIPSIQVYFSDTKILKADKLKNASRVDLIRPDSSMIINKLVSARKKGPDEFGTFYSNCIMQ